MGQSQRSPHLPFRLSLASWKMPTLQETPRSWRVRESRRGGAKPGSFELEGIEAAAVVPHFAAAFFEECQEQMLKGNVLGRTREL